MLLIIYSTCLPMVNNLTRSMKGYIREEGQSAKKLKYSCFCFVVVVVVANVKFKKSLLLPLGEERVMMFFF